MFWRLLLPLLAPGDDSGGGDQTDFSQDMADLASDDNVDDQSDKDDTDEDAEERPAPRSRSDKSSEKGDTGDESDDDAEDDTEDDDDEGESGRGKGKGDKGKGDEDDEESDEEGEDENKDDEEDEGEGKEPERFQGRPTVAQLKKAFPDIYKRFPDLRGVMASLEKYEGAIADPEQAEEIVLQAEHFQRLEESLVKGDPDLLMRELSEGSPQSFERVALQFMPKLRGMNNDLYVKASLPIVRELIFHVNKYGESLGDNGVNYCRAAKWFNQFVFQNAEIADITKDGGQPAKHPAEIELEKERAQAAQGRLTEARSDVNQRLDRSLRAMIAEGMDIPNKFIRDSIVEKTLDGLIDVFRADKSFQLKMKGLWQRAQASQFAESAKKRLVDAQADRARLAFKDIRARLMKEAGVGKKKSKEKDDHEEKDRNDDKNDRNGQPRKRLITSQGRPGSHSRGRSPVLDSRKIDYSKTSDMDILSDDSRRVTLKRG